MLVCITGEIGSGKSTALKIIEAESYQTYAMDDYIHDIYQKGKIGYQLIKKHFGNEYVNNEKVDRKKLGKLVFSDQECLDRLNKLMIPLMQSELEKMLEKSTLFFVEMGIYMHQEKAFSKYFSKVIFIEAKNGLKNKNLQKKIPYLRKLPTNLVGKLGHHTKTKNSPQYIVVGNHKNLKNFREEILKILQNFSN
jgi:dephospho-CoA kinase